MDDADRAQLVTEREQADILARQAAWPDHSGLQIARDGRVVCRECFAPISRERLRAHPQAVRCLDCQQTFERRQQR